MVRLPPLLKLALAACWIPMLVPGESAPGTLPTVALAEIGPSGPVPARVPRTTPTGPLVLVPLISSVPPVPLLVRAPVSLLLPESTKVLLPTLVSAPEPLIAPAKVVVAVLDVLRLLMPVRPTG